MIDDETRGRLRTVLLAEGEAGFLTALDLLLKDLATNPVLLLHTHEFAKENLDKTGPRLKARLSEVIEALGRRLHAVGSDSTALSALLVRVQQIDERKAGLEAELEVLKTTIAAVLGPGVEREVGSLGVKTGAQAHSLKITDAAKVPLAFLRNQPDRKAILRFYHDTGEPVEGTTVTPLRPSVRVWKL